MINEQFTNITGALDHATQVVNRIAGLQIPRINDETERRQVLNMVSYTRDSTELLIRILSDMKDSMGGKASTVRVSTSVDPRSACQIPPEVMEKEIKYQHADALAREVARHAITAIRQDPVFDMMVFETTVTFIAPEKEKNR
jgi:hypothetical protein